MKLFPERLYIMANDSLKNDVMWNKNGQGVIINRSILKSNIADGDYNWSEESSMIRQLYRYSFKRIYKTKTTKEYAHANFKRGRPELLQFIIPQNPQTLHGGKHTWKSMWKSGIAMLWSPFTEENPRSSRDDNNHSNSNDMRETIINEMLVSFSEVTWDDIVGLEYEKICTQRTFMWPVIRPDICTGLRTQPKGLLLFGPPGAGKTMIAKCIAGDSNMRFINVTASSTLSKYVGEAPKMIKAIFEFARETQPAVIFFDEIDLLLNLRSHSSHEVSKHLLNEFLIQCDGVKTNENDTILVIGATNKPEDTDLSVLRRLGNKVYIALPQAEGRMQMFRKLLQRENHTLTENNLVELCTRTKGYSASDLAGLYNDAAYGSVMEMSQTVFETIPADQVRPIEMQDFLNALHKRRPSVTADAIRRCEACINSPAYDTSQED